jgi:hypothetical protein
MLIVNEMLFAVRFSSQRKIIIKIGVVTYVKRMSIETLHLYVTNLYN